MDSEQRGEQAAQAAGSGGKKRRRRTAAQIDRKFACNYPGCSKAYGSEGSLTQHQRLKHPQSAKEALAAARKAQSLTMSLMLACCPLYKLSAMFLPRPASGSLKGGATLPPSAAPAVRAVNIRPATMGVLPGSPFQVGSPAHAASPMPPLAPDALGEIRNASSTLRIMRAASEDAAMGGHRNLRSRSNSMPISISAPLPAQSQRAAPSSTRTPSQRKARGSSTPRPKSTTARRAKARSKSESLTGLPGFPPADIIQPPRSDRSVSDSTASTHESIAPIEISDAQAFRSSWSVSDPMTMEEQAIDSDILSVLADCDSNELGSDGQSIDVPRAPRSAPVVPFNSPAFTNMEDQEMLPAGLECFKIAEGIPSVELTRAMKRKPFTGQLSFQHNVDKVNVGATGIRGGPGCLFGVPDALISEGKVGNHASNLELVPPHVGAFGDISDAFTLQPYDAPIENDSHNLSHMNSYSDNGAMDFANIDALAPIQTFHATDASSKDPGTPLQGISTKVQKLNIESEACWSDAAILLNEPDHEESLSQQHNHQQALWDKGDPFSSSLESGHADSIQDPTAHDSTSGTDWDSSKGTASAAANYYFGTPSSHSEGTPTRYFGDILMSDATEFAMVDSRAQSHLLGQNDDLI